MQSELKKKAGAVGPDSASAIQKTDEEWQHELTPEQYRVLRCHGTERAGSSPLNDEHREGRFRCAACGEPLFSSGAKFDSGTGWPSFYEPVVPDAVGTSVDRQMFVPRTEVHCRRCGGHLGHVFEDGPAPSGLRYCMNGLSLRFEPAKDAVQEVEKDADQ